MHLIARLVITSLVTAASALSATAFAADAIPAAPDLIGYCPVAYVAVGKPVKGDLHFVSTVAGHTYWFVNADAKKAFDTDPSKYRVACDGYCAFAAAKGFVFPGDPQFFSVRAGTIYFFVNAETKQAFDQDATMAAIAEKAWPALAPKK